jgi:hypothetical protein
MAQRGGVVNDEGVAGVEQRRQVGRRVEQGAPSGQRRQHRLLPAMTGAVGEAARGPQDLVALGAQRRQPDRHLARQPLDAADVRAHRRAGIDGDRRCGRPGVAAPCG